MNTIRKNISFEKSDYNYLREFARKRGYGPRGISTALRHMIRDFEERNPIQPVDNASQVLQAVSSLNN